MCGTPFPHRALTVPSAQSTLHFTSTPVEISPATGMWDVREASPEPMAEEPVAASAQESNAGMPLATETEPVELPEFVTEAGPVAESTSELDTEYASLQAAGQRETFADVPPEPVSVALDAAAVVEVAQPVEDLPIGPSEVTSDPGERPSSPVEEPEQPTEPPAREPEPEEPPIREPEPEEPTLIREPVPVPDDPQKPAEEVHAPEAAHAPIALPQRPAARVVVMPTPHPEPAELEAQDIAKVHPPPDSLPITLPPDSAGMPTFKEIAEASGPPVISPFEPPKAVRGADDRELEEFVANFRWTPPAETADELTMRSEVPVIDKEAPAEFHHPSFDGDEAPPPEAGPHPTGQEFYDPNGTAPRPRFLDVGESSSSQPHASGKSLLGLDSAPTTVPADELVGASPRRGWLWGSILAAVAIFGGLGYLEGRAQSTHAFRGPVEFVRDEYNDLRQRLQRKAEPAAVEPEKTPAETAKPPETQPQPDASTQPAAAQPESAQQTPPAAASTNTNQQQQQNPPAGGTQTANGGAAPPPTDVTPAKPLEAPLPKPSSKPQPGQQELAKAMNASDAAATAAWLWKSTSRGNPEAPVRLADMYIKGNGVAKSCEQALVLLRAAAMKENAPARNRLAALYANGTCVTRDRVKAYQLMTSALEADPNSEWAKENRQNLWNQMTPPQRAEAQQSH